MNPLAAWNNSLWLCHPNKLQQIAASVAGFRTCFSRAEVLAAREEDRARARDVAALTLAGEGTGVMCESEITEWSIKVGDVHTGSKIRTEAPRAIRAVRGKVGVIPIYGPTDQRMSSALMKSGGTSLEFVSQAFDVLMANPAVGCVILHMDCPGGGTYGVSELSDKIYASRGEKPTYCMIDSMACSAGFWIGSACSMMVCTPGGDTGSVGVYALHYDDSAQMEMQGIKVTPVSSGKYKTEFFGPLGDEARASLQESVDQTHDKFIAAVKRNRNTTTDDVRQNYGQGRVVSADKALKLGMVDRVMPFSELLAKLQGSASEQQKSATRADVLRMKHAHRQRQRIIA